MDSNSAKILEIKKICKKCGQDKPLSKFKKLYHTRATHTGKCKDCINEDSRMLWKKDPNKGKQRSIRWQKLNPDRFAEFLKKKNKNKREKTKEKRLSKGWFVNDISEDILNENGKICLGCKKRLKLENFYNNRRHISTGKESLCKVCFRMNHAKYKYGITKERFEQYWVDQGGSCAICRNQLDRFSRKTHIDHCHTSGKVRGILCQKCNTALGLAKDNIKWLESAIDYLLKSRMV